MPALLPGENDRTPPPTPPPSTPTTTPGHTKEIIYGADTPIDQRLAKSDEGVESWAITEAAITRQQIENRIFPPQVKKKVCAMLRATGHSLAHRKFKSLLTAYQVAVNNGDEKQVCVLQAAAKLAEFCGTAHVMEKREKDGCLVPYDLPSIMEKEFYDNSAAKAREAFDKLDPTNLTAMWKEGSGAALRTLRYVFDKEMEHLHQQLSKLHTLVCKALSVEAGKHTTFFSDLSDKLRGLANFEAVLNKKTGNFSRMFPGSSVLYILIIAGKSTEDVVQKFYEIKKRMPSYDTVQDAMRFDALYGHYKNKVELHILNNEGPKTNALVNRISYMTYRDIMQSILVLITHCVGQMEEMLKTELSCEQCNFITTLLEVKNVEQDQHACRKLKRALIEVKNVEQEQHACRRSKRRKPKSQH